MKTSTHILAAGIVMLAATSLYSEIQIDEVFIDTPIDGPPPGMISVPPPTTSGGGDPATAAAPTGFGDQIVFLNKDKLHGGLVTASPEGFGLKWKHVNVEKPIEFKLDRIASIALERRAPAAPQSHASTIALSNDDLIRGNIVTLDDQHLVVDTDYAGRLSIRRVMVSAIHPNTAAAFTIYEGPKDLASWTQSRHGSGKSWELKKNALYALQSYPIGRTIPDLPDSATIEFDLAWRNYPQLYFAFYTDNIQQYYGNCYMLQISSSSVYLQRYSRNGNQSNMGNVQLPQFSSGRPGHAHFSLLVDKKSKTIALLIDGKLVKEWKDTGDFAGKGSGILFQPQSQGNLKISGIRVSRWDGKLPKPVESTTVEKEDMVRFANNDKVSGKLQTIEDNNIKFKTSYATLDIPLTRIVEISMATENTERARRNKHDLRAHFTGEGSITLQLNQIADQKLTGQSENFGTATIPLDVLRLLEFNIYDKKEEDDDDGFTF